MKLPIKRIASLLLVFLVLVIWAAAIGLLCASIMHGFYKTFILMIPITAGLSYLKAKLEIRFILNP